MDILEIEGVGREYKKKLNKIGINTVEALLVKGATPKARKEIEQKTGISHKLILEWVNLADLLRIKGIGEEYSDLLKEAGVDSVAELAQRNPDNLFEKIIEANAEKKHVRQSPSLSMVKDWIEQARILPGAIFNGDSKKTGPKVKKRPLSKTFTILFGLSFFITLFVTVLITGRSSPLFAIAVPLLIFGIILLTVLAFLFIVKNKNNENRAKVFKIGITSSGIIAFAVVILMIITATSSSASVPNSSIDNGTTAVASAAVSEVSVPTVAEITQTENETTSEASGTTAKVTETTAAKTISEETASAQASETGDVATIETNEPAPAGYLKVHFINVGQGDSTLVQTAEGNTMLIDGGPTSNGENLTRYLQQQGVSKINLIISTHPHEDHIGGLISILNNFEVGNIIDSGVPHTTQTYTNYLSAVQSNNINFINWSVGQKFDLGRDVSFTILGPTTQSDSNLNNLSMVIKLTYKDTTFLFTGDAESIEEGKIISSGANLDSDVLKVGHHGSSSASSMKFLNAVSPEIAVNSCGVSNNYGHPHDITLKDLAGVGAIIYRTDLTGTIVIESDGNTEKVSQGSSYTYASKEAEATQATEAAQPPATSPPETTVQTETAAPEAETTALSGQYVGSVNSDVFHYPSCSSVKSIHLENIVWFSSRDDAIAQGKRPCKKCNP